MRKYLKKRLGSKKNYNYADHIAIGCKNPCMKVWFKGNVAKVDPWSFDEYIKFIHVVDSDEYKLFFNMLYYTGMRVREALALEIRDIDKELLGHEDASTMDIYSRTTTKGL
ncbi:MAG: hypothetical protein RSA73_04200 [Anaerovoracaceae bacterium]